MDFSDAVWWWKVNSSVFLDEIGTMAIVKINCEVMKFDIEN
jgi:hypothetical protein